MKKFVAIVLALLILGSFVLPVFAEDTAETKVPSPTATEYPGDDTPTEPESPATGANPWLGNNTWLFVVIILFSIGGVVLAGKKLLKKN